MRCFRLLIAALCGVLFVSNAAAAQQRNDVFGDANRIQGWIGTYRDNPQPGRVPALVKAIAAKGLIQEQDRAGIYIGFVAGVLADNQIDADKLVTAMFPLPPAAQVLVIKAIVYSGLPDWKQRLGRFVERMPARQILIRKFLYGKKPTLSKLPLDKGPEVLDTWWGYYFATGSYEPVLRIMQALKWSEEKDKLERLTVGSMAKWTLASHAANNKHLLDFCRSEIAHQSKQTAKVLREVVAAAETFETGKIRKQAVAAISELKTKGPASRRKWAWWGQAGQMALSVGCVAAAATGQVYLGLPCVIGGAASSAALKLWSAQQK
ncbi:MAG: hypothetical protein ACR2PI_16170 [Hyphomicrobiaceae bacterium]